MNRLSSYFSDSTLACSLLPGGAQPRPLGCGDLRKTGAVPGAPPEGLAYSFLPGGAQPRPLRLMGTNPPKRRSYELEYQGGKILIQSGYYSQKADQNQQRQQHFYTCGMRG